MHVSPPLFITLRDTDTIRITDEQINGRSATLTGAEWLMAWDAAKQATAAKISIGKSPKPLGDRVYTILDKEMRVQRIRADWFKAEGGFIVFYILEGDSKTAIAAYSADTIHSVQVAPNTSTEK